MQTPRLIQTGAALDKTAEKAETVAVSAGRAPLYVSQSARLECSTGTGRGASKMATTTE